ncbi:MAG: peptidyl-prolyl cis-trans isomerase [Desulfobacula sp.]|nr:peptidyl-prolyl cis-trans isomerase [Desulfobacula sp.]
MATFSVYQKKRGAIFIFFTLLFIMLFAGCGKEKSSSDPDVVAVYDGGQITRKEVEDNIENLVQRVAPDMIEQIKNKEVYKRLIQSMAVDQMVKAKIKEKKLDKKDNIKHALKHISEEININEMHSRAHDSKIKVSQTDIKIYYENNRETFKKRPLNEVKEDIRDILQEKKETEYFKSYMEDLKKNAVITREDRLLKVPVPSKTDLKIFFEENRTKYGGPKKSYSDVKDQVLTDLSKKKEHKWFKQNKNRTLFTIHGKRHTVGEFYEEFNELAFSEQEKYQTYDSKIDLLERIIQRLLVVEDTYDQMLDTETKEEVSHAREDILKQLLHQEEVDDKLEIKDDQVKAYYEQHKKEFKKPPRVRISYIRIGFGQTDDEGQRAKLKVKEAYKKLKPGFFKKGASFENIAMEYSEDPETAKNGGKLDKWISEGENIIEEISSHRFHEKVTGLSKDEISSPFQFNGSWYIVMVKERKEPEQVTYEDARDHIKEALLQQKHEELTYGMGETLLKQANLIIFDDIIESMLKNK